MKTMTEQANADTCHCAICAGAAKGDTGLVWSTFARSLDIDTDTDKETSS